MRKRKCLPQTKPVNQRFLGNPSVLKYEAYNVFVSVRRFDVPSKLTFDFLLDASKAITDDGQQNWLRF